MTDARQQSDSRLSALQRATAIAEVAAELANAARFEDLAEVVLRGAKVLGAAVQRCSPSSPTDDGPLRVHMTRGLADEVQGHIDYPVEGIEIQLDDPQPTQYAAKHGERVLLASQEEMVTRFPASREGSEVLGVRAVAALPLRVEGRVLGSFVALWTVDHPFSEDDVELLEALAAQIALSVSRLRAGDERAAAVAAMAEANERLQLLADAGRVLSGSLDIHRADRSARGARRPGAGRLVLARGHRRAGPPARAGVRAPGPRTPGGAAALRRVDGHGHDRRGRRPGSHPDRQPLVLREIDRARVIAALPDPGSPGGPRAAGRRVRRHRAARGAGPDAGRPRSLHREGARPAHPR